MRILRRICRDEKEKGRGARVDHLAIALEGALVDAGFSGIDCGQFITEDLRACCFDTTLR